MNVIQINGRFLPLSQYYYAVKCCFCYKTPWLAKYFTIQRQVSAQWDRSHLLLQATPLSPFLPSGYMYLCTEQISIGARIKRMINIMSLAWRDIALSHIVVSPCRSGGRVRGAVVYVINMARKQRHGNIPTYTMLLFHSRAERRWLSIASGKSSRMDRLDT